MYALVPTIFKNVSVARPLSYGVEVAACVHNSGNLPILTLFPNPWMGSDVHGAHDGLPQSIDTVLQVHETHGVIGVRGPRPVLVEAFPKQVLRKIVSPVRRGSILKS